MPTFLEFFAGIGLVRLGLERAGWDCVWANDIDPKKLTMYRGYFNADHYLVGDIHGLNANQLPDAILATCSFPCVDMSVAGNYAGFNADRDDDPNRSGTFWEFVRLLTEMENRRPPMIMVENVIGFLSANGGIDFRNALLALNQLGYAIDAFVLDASHFTPQSRQRLFIIGSLFVDGFQAEDKLEALITRSIDLRPTRLMNFVRVNIDLNWMHLQFPDLPQANHLLDEIIEELPADDPAWWDQTQINRLFAERLNPRHLEMIRRLVTEDHITYRSAFNRVRNGRTYTEVRTDDIAGCLRTPNGGGSRQIVIAAGQNRLRARLMTAREAARLQGVPDDFPLVGSLNDSLWGFGDAVCVPAITWIAENALNPLLELLQQRENDR